MSLFHDNVLLGASGSGDDLTYSDDVFSTFLYDGNNGSQTITNGVDLSGEGGLVWVKSRSNAENHALFDSERGTTKFLRSDSDDPEYTIANTAFTSTGFSYNTSSGEINENGQNYCSWTFRKAPGFFDVVTWTGNGSNRTISHSLGSTPGFIIVKRTSASEDWTCWHRSLGATKYIQLNGTAGSNTVSSIWNDTEPTSTVFSVGTHNRVNTNGETYVAYIFAHDDQSFGTDSDEAIIKCDTYTGNATGDSSTQDINVGFEPQWVLIKKTSGTADWILMDNMRGHRSILYPSDPKVQDISTSVFKFITPSGFRVGANTDVNQNNETFIYIAIRRPHKPPETATEVFKAVTYSGSGSAQNITGAGFAPDWMWSKDYSASNNGWYHDRIRGVESLDSSGAGGEQDRTSYVDVLGQDGIDFVTGGFDLNRSGSSHVAQFMKRAPGFFDIVTFIGNSASSQNVSHNLGVVPEMMILKNRQSNFDWNVYHASLGNNKALVLNDTSVPGSSTTAAWNNTTPTASVFSVGDNAYSNQGSQPIVAWLWATLPGISKVGTYTGTGSNVNVDCGFSAAARYILIKRAIGGTGSWYIWDHARGIVAGNDPYLIANTTAAQATGNDYIDPLSSGFTVTSSAPDELNKSGDTYIFLAIA